MHSEEAVSGKAPFPRHMQEQAPREDQVLALNKEIDLVNANGSNITPEVWCEIRRLIGEATGHFAAAKTTNVTKPVFLPAEARTEQAMNAALDADPDSMAHLPHLPHLRTKPLSCPPI